ncbi:PD-(D/E)XK nuclease family protein [Marmoricola sp. Leaf446]|uniref:RecB family exonuclease n=1 Tax=Marmoricola sp. Leaf446 TaxID=1736379 RepID=UPI000B2771BF|nr:PD-(D/E)XK nuclease family protein [Marmoricola sp. Leaf446]
MDTTRIGTPVDGELVVGSLSPSRAADFRTCPLLYRFRTVDRLPEAPSPEAVRGTVVHKVLEDLFDLPAPQRTPEAALALVGPAWAALLEGEPELAALFPDGAEVPAQAWREQCRAAVRAYFELEDPRRLEPAERELYVEALLGSRLLLRGFVDRLDVASDGALRVVDYKTGRAPAPGFEARALFQLRFYALVLWRSRGVVPRELRLVYLAAAETVSYAPDEADLLFTERLVQAVWEAVREARETGDWQPQRGRACSWCSFRDICPAWGGTPPPLPVASADDVPVEQGAEVGGREPGQALAAHPAGAVGDGHVVGHHQDPAAGGLGRGGARG